MKKLNNRGLTAVEVIICFSITSVIVISLFKVIANYNEKQYMESRKSQIKTYENIVTKTIQDDVLKNEGIKSVELNFTDQFSLEYGRIDIDLKFTNDETASLTIYYNQGGINAMSDRKTIEYTDSSDEKEEFKLNIPEMEFNEPKIDYDEDNGMLNIYVGVFDNDLGDKYSVLDMHFPLTEKWPDAYKKSNE